MSLEQPKLVSFKKWNRCNSWAKLFLGILAIVTGFYFCVDRITPVELTITSIDETFVRISIYAKVNGSIPLSLDLLPERAGYANSTTDGWGRPLIYTVAKDGLLTLASLGKDGKPGGSGEDADISSSYHAKKPDGSLWIVSDERWITDAEAK